jgi:putative sigma-54 modulation protein
MGGNMVNKNKFAVEDAEPYKIHILGRNVYVTEAMKNYALDKISKIDRFHNHHVDVHVTMDMQKLDHSVVIVLKFDHFKVKVSASSTDMYASIDKAVHRLQTQIRRWKDRIQDHHKKEHAVFDMPVSVLERPFDREVDVEIDIEEVSRSLAEKRYKKPKIIGTDSRVMKLLTTDEAVMKMELSDDNFLIFRGEEDHKLKVIYRRSDGNYGIILPE